jgi:hypothetical protein
MLVLRLPLSRLCMAGIIGKYTVTKLQAPEHTTNELEIKRTPDISLTLKGPTIECVNEVLTATNKSSSFTA